MQFGLHQLLRIFFKKANHLTENKVSVQQQQKQLPCPLPANRAMRGDLQAAVASAGSLSLPGRHLGDGSR